MGLSSLAPALRWLVVAALVVIASVAVYACVVASGLPSAAWASAAIGAAALAAALLRRLPWRPATGALRSGAGSPGRRVADRTVAPGPTLGPYRVQGELGRGAMGTIYLGVDSRSGERVAIKTMALVADFDAAERDEARARFFREAETAARLRHPDIVAVHDWGEAGGTAYIAMELLRGSDLQAHTMPAALLPLPTAIETMARVADALAYANTQGVVHRDVKPSNVIVDAANGSVKLADFGIARLADWSRTRTGAVLGTPDYMAPEQLAGRPVDGRADVYAAGVVLFELLTGRRPHAAESVSRLMYCIVNQPAPDVRTLRPELPAALAAVVARALAKRPEDRYADAAAFARELRAAAHSAHEGAGGAG